MKSSFCGRLPADADVRPGACGGVADAVERVASALDVEPSAVAKRVDDAPPAAPPLRRRRRDRAVDALAPTPARARPPSAGSSLATSTSCGSSAPRADARVLERDEALLGVALLGDRVEVRRARAAGSVGREHERGEDERRADRRDPAALHDELGPAASRRGWPCRRAHVRPVEPRAELGEHDRQQRDRDERR